MQRRILLVEDDKTVSEMVVLVLEGAGFAVTAVGDGVAAVAAAAADPPPELIVLDVMLPGLSGLDVCRAVRVSSKVPIVMLTARADTRDVVAGLELGADDYVTKPFEPSELAARVRAVLRRSSDDEGGLPTSDTVVRDLVIDEAAFRVMRADTEISLTAMEFRLLGELVQHTGSVLKREVLLDRVWGHDYLGDSRLVDVAVMRLRGKLGSPVDPPEYITTVRGVGYRFERG